MVRHTRIATYLHPLRKRQSYSNLFYLFMTLVLGAVYLSVPSAFFLSGQPFWLTIPLFTLILLLMVQPLATFERSTLRLWLKLDIPTLAHSKGQRISLWKRYRTFLESSVIWKNLVYLLAKALFGGLISAIVFAVFGVAFVLFFGSLLYVITLVTGLHILSVTDWEGFEISLKPIVQIFPFAGIARLPTSLALVRLGLMILMGPLIFVGAIHLSNGFILLWKRFASYTLSVNKKDLQIIEARQLADQERVRAELADQKRRELITNVSHELRTPVASIQGHVEALLNLCGNEETELPPPAVLRQYLTIVQRESLQLGMLVDHLLALARAEKDEINLQLEATAASEVIEEVYQALMPLARRERQITLMRQVVANLPPVLADRQRLKQILLNLVRNAITNTPDGGIVSISLDKADDAYLALLIADTGIGIPPEDQERIFERFYRADASRSRRSGGAGLGLAIVRDFVSAMQGSISVESTVGEGSTFRVLLPITSSDRRLPLDTIQALKP